MFGLSEVIVMGDRSPKDKQKQKKQHDKQVQDLNRARQEKQQRSQQPPPGAPQDPHKKAG